MIGQTISHYKILEKLGEGGMGVVYKAQDTKLKRDVALKFLPQYLTSDKNEKERFYHEAQAASALNHQNVTTIHEISEFGDQVYIAMEYVEGKTLKHLVEHEGLPVKKILDIAIQVCDGLAAAHEKGIVHRDIKSENIMLKSKGQVKIMDFGLAQVKGATKLTKEGSTLGTAAYMSPEQARGEEVDHRTDIFSFGVVLYEMLSGRTPFRGEHTAALIYSIANEEPTPLARYNEEVTDEIQHIVSKVLEKERDDRYQHVDEILSDLRRERKKLEYIKSGYVKAGEIIQPVILKPRRSYVGIIITISVVLILVTLIIFFNPFNKHNQKSQTDGAGEKSIAVLPFVDMSPLKDQEYFCDGMTDELINRLSNVRELKVPARTSVFTFKGKTYDIKDVGDKLHVQTVLEGSVQKSADRLRIIVQLINVSDGYHLWSDKYDRELKDVFAIQDEISSAIVSTLQLKLTSQEQQRMSEHPIANVKAYDYYLRADREVMRYDEKSLDTALIYLRTAIDIMGDNAYLFSGMAGVYSQYANAGFRQEDYFQKAEEYAKKALALKSDFPTALCVLGTLSLYKEYPKNYLEAFEYFKKALAVNPNEIRAIHGITNVYEIIGKVPIGLPYLERLEQSDPLNPRRYILRGYAYLYNCNFESALGQFFRLYQNDSTSPLAHTAYTQALAYNGKRDEALAVIGKMRKSDEKNVMNTYTLLLKCGLLNDRAGALRLITPDFRKTCMRDVEWSYWVANRLSLSGAKSEAMDWLENAINLGFINYPYFQCDPFLDNIRDNSRFKKLMEKAKYEWEHFKVPE
jgi:serine/threonine protein kinase